MSLSKVFSTFLEIFDMVFDTMSNFFVEVNPHISLLLVFVSFIFIRILLHIISFLKYTYDIEGIEYDNGSVRFFSNKNRRYKK